MKKIKGISRNLETKKKSKVRKNAKNKENDRNINWSNLTKNRKIGVKNRIFLHVLFSEKVFYNTQRLPGKKIKITALDINQVLCKFKNLEKNCEIQKNHSYHEFSYSFI